jgi:hypothetical protein
MSHASVVKPTPHRLGKLFEILAEKGEDMRFRCVLQRVSGGEPVGEWVMHHKDVDGYGSVVTFLRAQGIAFAAPNGRPETQPPSLPERVRAFLRVVTLKPNEEVRFRVRNPEWKPGERVTRRAEAGRLLSEAETQRVVAAAKADGVSVNSRLLHTLNEAVTPLVADVRTQSSWGVPVNMRGPVRVEPELANASSIVPVTIRTGAPVREVDATIRSLINENYHWGKWDQVNLMIRFGERATRKKIDQYYRGADPARVGVFSNVGVWSGATDGDVGLVPYGTPTLVDPIFAAAITWNGKLGVALRVHPSVTLSDELVGTWLSAWLGKLLPEALAEAA